MKERRSSEHSLVRRKLVLVGDEQCGKTAMLHVLAKDSYPEVIIVIKLLTNYTVYFIKGGLFVFTLLHKCVVFH